MDEKDVLQFNNYELQDIGSYLRRTSNNSDSLHQESKQKFDPIVAKHLFEEGMKIINDRIQNLSDKLSNTERVILSNADSMATLEAQLKNEASQIEIPKGFETNNTITDKSFAANTYSKVDGKSVNNGALNSIDETQVESTISRNKNLKDITKDTELDTKNLDEFRNNKVGLNDITSDREQEMQDLNFRNVVDEATLTNINDGNETVLTDQEMNSRIEKQELEDIRGE